MDSTGSEEFSGTPMIEEWSRHVKLFQHLIAAIRRFHLHFIQILKEASFSSSSSSAAVARDKSPAAHHNGLSSGSMRLAVRSRSWLSSLIIVTMLLNISSASYLLPRISSSSDNVVAIPLLGSPNTGYCAYITIGTPAVQEFCVLVDTGSANLAVAGAPDSSINTHYSPSKSSSGHVSSQSVSVHYSVGWWDGKLVTDKIKLGAMAAVTAGFTMITRAEQFYIAGADWVGIMGMAYESIAAAGSGAVTFWSTLRAAVVMRDVFSIKMCPPLHDKAADITVTQGGEMILGGYNSTENVHWTRIVEKNYYKVLLTDLAVGNTTINLPCNEFNQGSTILDSGTTDIYFPVNVFNNIRVSFAKHFLTNLGPMLNVPEPFWDNDYKLAWPTDSLTSLYKLFPCFYVSFAFDDDATKQFSIAVTPQMYLREVEGDIFEQADNNCYPQCTFLTFGIRPREKGTVLSSNLMIGYLCIFDRENERIGFAQSTCAYPDEIGEFDQPHFRVGTRDPIDCSYRELPSPLQLASYSFGSFIVAFTFVGAILVCTWRRMTKKCIKWYYEKSFIRTLKRLIKFKRMSNQDNDPEGAELLNNYDTCSLQSEDPECNSVDSHTNAILTSSGDSSDSGIVVLDSLTSTASFNARMSESTIPSDSPVVEDRTTFITDPAIAATSVATPDVVKTFPAVNEPSSQDPAVDKFPSPAVIESMTSPADNQLIVTPIPVDKLMSTVVPSEDTVEKFMPTRIPIANKVKTPTAVVGESPTTATSGLDETMTFSSSREVEQIEEESVHVMKVGIRPSNNYHHIPIAHGNYASVNTYSDDDPPLRHPKIEEARREKKCRTDRRIILEQYHGSTATVHDFVDETLDEAEDDALGMILEEYFNSRQLA